MNILKHIKSYNNGYSWNIIDDFSYELLETQKQLFLPTQKFLIQ